MNNPVGLHPDDLDRVLAKFGVAEEQVRRDHAISHILAALSREHRDDVIFMGGTALSRTYLRDERLSEDVDLIAIHRRDALADALAVDIRSALMRTHGRIVWAPRWTNRDVEPAIALTADRIAIKIQLLRGANYEPWPVELRELDQRYRDAPAAILRVPTLPAFAGWKTATWLDRRASRDLYDLWALSNIGALNSEAASLFAAHGPTNGPPQQWMFESPPDERDWQAQLAGQTRLTVTSRGALTAVRAAWARAVNQNWA